MQVFEVLEINEYPYMITKEVYGETVGDVINESNEEKVFLIVDHNLNRIWPYNGYKTSYKLQIFGVKMAEMLNRQLKLLYSIKSLHIFSNKNKKFQEIMEKSLGGGIAEAVRKEDFLEFLDGYKVKADTTVILDVNVTKALDYISEIPPPENHIKKFTIVSGNVYTDEKIAESFVMKEQTVKNNIKLGRLNRGFTSFLGNYSTRLIIYDRRVQAIELYIAEKEKDKTKLLKLDIPIFTEEKFTNEGNLETLIDAFQIPNELPEEKKE